MTSSEPPIKDPLVPFRPKRPKIYTITQSYPVTIAGSTSVETDGSITPSLISMGDAAAFASIFDSYRLAGVKAIFTPVNDETASTTGFAPLYTVLDYDDNLATTLTVMLQYDTLKVATFGSQFVRTAIPAIAMAGYTGTAFTATVTEKLRWVDCANQSVPWYCIKYAMPTSSSITTWYVIVECTWQFKNVRQTLC